MEQQGDFLFVYSWPNTVPADISIDGATIERDQGMETAVLVSVFSDARAADSDPLPDQGDEPRGWWGGDLVGLPLGSKLWLLSRSKLTSQTVEQARQYVADALNWMITDGMVDQVTVSAARSAGDVNRVDFTVKILRTKGLQISFRFFYNWKQQIFGGI
jgi:phage gp46-like protein